MRMANFLDLRNRLIDLFGESQRAEVFERLNLARTAGHLPPARSRGDRQRADLTSLDCAVAILALVSSDRGYEAGKQLNQLRALPAAEDGSPRLDEFLAGFIEERRKTWPDTDCDYDKKLTILVWTSPLPIAASCDFRAAGLSATTLFGESELIGKPLLGTGRLISGEILGAVADLLGPIEDATG